MRSLWVVVSFVVGCGDAKPSQAPSPVPVPADAATTGSAKPDPKAEAAAQRRKRIARAKALELPTRYEPPPGDPLSHHASGYAKTMCSAVFITKLDLEFAKEHVGYFTAPYDVRKQLAVTVDAAGKRVSVKLPNGVVRTAVYTGGQGCVTLAEGADKLAFTPTAVPSKLPPARSQPWPMGDQLDAPFPKELDKAKIQAAVDAAFEPAHAETMAFVVTWRGQLIGERYAKGITHETPLESWSMGKTVIGTLMGVLIQQGTYKLDQPAPISEWWQAPDDPRAKITIADLYRMSSGLRCVSPADPEFDPDGKLNADTWPNDGHASSYPDHVYLYTGADAFKYAATRPQQWPPNTVGRYRNTDPLLLAYLTRLAVENRGESYHGFPQRALFDKLGIRTMVLETDAHGNFLTSGYELASARDWARIGNLYLNDGVAPNGERLLPEGFVKFASTPAPAWVADEQPMYGGMVWITTSGIAMMGAGGQIVAVSPRYDLVVVRLGHFKGTKEMWPSFRRAMDLLKAAVPQKP